MVGPVSHWVVGLNGADEVRRDHLCALGKVRRTTAPVLAANPAGRLPKRLRWKLKTRHALVLAHKKLHRHLVDELVERMLPIGARLSP